MSQARGMRVGCHRVTILNPQDAGVVRGAV